MKFAENFGGARSRERQHVTTVLWIVFAVASPLVSADVLRHNWDTVGSMIFAHGSSSYIISDKSLYFLADTYSLTTFGNCYGHEDSPQETATLMAAEKMKAHNPQAKVGFYWKSDLASQMEKCSLANATWNAHPEWRLRDDKGNVVTPNRFDPTNPAFAQFWVGHLVDLGKQRSRSGALLLDAFFIDGPPNSPNDTHVKGIGPKRAAVLINATYDMCATLQARLRSDGTNQMVILNANDNDFSSTKHASTGAEASMVDHFGILQFIDDHTGEYKPAAMDHLMRDIIRSKQSANRTLQIKGWPGPIIKQPDHWPNNTGPQTLPEFRGNASALFNSELALFLLVVEENFWWGYSWFWHIGDWEPYENTSTVPREFYPELKCPLGAPLGPPTKKDGTWLYQREFKHASVTVNLEKRSACKVVFHNCPS